jgi:hypothetical protein
VLPKLLGVRSQPTVQSLTDPGAGAVQFRLVLFRSESGFAGRGELLVS